MYINPELFLGPLPCNKCGGHFWATKLDAGNVRSQLIEHFEGEEWIVDQMMAQFGLPMHLEQPMYWHIWLTGTEFQAYNRSGLTAAWARSRELFRSILAVMRKAS